MLIRTGHLLWWSFARSAVSSWGYSPYPLFIPERQVISKPFSVNVTCETVGSVQWAVSSCEKTVFLLHTAH